MQNLHLLVPMSGQGTRYRKAGYTQPKPLIPVNGVPMIERLLSTFPTHWTPHFVMADNHEETELPALLTRLRPNSTISFIPQHTKGPGEACLAGLKHIPDDAPVLVSYCDYGMVWDPAAFERFVADTECDSCVVSYKGFHAHYLSDVMYAYSRMEGERVVEVKEKGCFTDDREAEYASCGAYYFRSARLLKDALKWQVDANLQINGEYYTSLTVEALLKMEPSSHVRIFEIPGFFQWGTPSDLQSFEYWEQTYQAYNRYVGQPRPSTGQVLMPMAGLGSRFKDNFDQPKPFIPVNGRPMYQSALGSLPSSAKTALVLNCENVHYLESSISDNSQTTWVSLDETPPGQALSCAAGLPELDPERDLVVSSCDHAVVLNPEVWKEFQSLNDTDAAIFTVQGYPGALRTPKSYAYVVPEDASLLPVVKDVSVKATVSDQPMNDHLLVGTFWFRTPDIMRKGIDELVARDIRVNGELYLDSIFTILRDLGMRVRMIPLDGFICWGDPASLAEASYWSEVFCGHRLDRRPRFPERQ